jgi:uncharacterized protein YndB with AHSA1/START domain
MTEQGSATGNRSVAHGSFTIERAYPVSPERVFAAWSDRDVKNKWFGEGDDFFSTTNEYTLDFRVGGHERLDAVFGEGRSFVYDATFEDIVDGERIVASYDVLIDGRRISVSLMTIEFKLLAGGIDTRLVVTEQGAFLDGLDDNEQREVGAADSLDRLGSYLESERSRPRHD